LSETCLPVWRAIPRRLRRRSVTWRGSARRSVRDLFRELSGLLDPARHLLLGRQKPDQLPLLVDLPHGLGKSKKVLVIASGEKVREAEAAGADFVGGEDMVEKITKENWTDFDALIATPDMMKSVGRLGKVLGPKGLMPNPKTGTVTMDVARAVQEVKAGKVEFRTDKTALVHVPVGKISFTPDKLIDNATVLISSVIKAKPAVAKGKYIKGCYLSSSMGPGIALDTTPIEVAAKA